MPSKTHMERLFGIVPKSDEASLPVSAEDPSSAGAAGKPGKKIKGKKGEAMENQSDEVSLGPRWSVNGI